MCRRMASVPVNAARRHPVLTLSKEEVMPNLVARGLLSVAVVEGYAHIDVVSSEDDVDNTLLAPLHDFLVRNTP